MQLANQILSDLLLHDFSISRQIIYLIEVCRPFSLKVYSKKAFTQPTTSTRSKTVKVF